MKDWKRRGMLVVVVSLASLVGLLLLATRSQAESDAPAAPTDVRPLNLVSNLDLSCHRAEGGKPPVERLRISHLNPVLKEMGIKEQEIYLDRLEQLCVPVAKNGVKPPKPILEIVRWVDLACFAAEGEPLDIDLKLSHLNPVLQEMGIEGQDVVVGQLAQLCVPVVKNDVFPPDEIMPLVEHIDVACYDIDTAEKKPFPLHLTHLNPVLKKEGLVSQRVAVEIPQQLCVPVMKEDLYPPDEVVRIVQWIDFLKYSERPRIPLSLRHINPLFRDLDPLRIDLLEVEQLALPVAKNGEIPPD